MSHRYLLTLAASATALAIASCARNPAPAADASPRFATLPDTTICVVDPATDQGLRDLTAKRAEDGRVVLLVEGELQALESVHPVSLIAGYAGAERWFSSGEQIAFQGQRFARVEGERRVSPELLRRVGEYRGVLLFGDPKDEPPAEAVYVPVRPGCIFQAYVREDLLRRSRGGP